MNHKSPAVLVVVVIACVMAIVSLPMLYLVSTGPVIWLMHKRYVSTDFCNAYITPMNKCRFPKQWVFRWVCYWIPEESPEEQDIL